LACTDWNVEYSTVSCHPLHIASIDCIALSFYAFSTLSLLTLLLAKQSVLIYQSYWYSYIIDSTKYASFLRCANTKIERLKHVFYVCKPIIYQTVYAYSLANHSKFVDILVAK